MQLPRMLGIDQQSPAHIAICGGGGKTTLLYALAREAAATGLKSAIYTTTHIMRPDAEDMAVFEQNMPQEMFAAWRAGKVVVTGKQLPDGRLAIPPDEITAFLHKHAEFCVVEADGAKRLPCKFPDHSHEPVIPPQTTMSIVVFGLSALDKPFSSFCHRATLAKERLSLDPPVIDEMTIARLILAGYAYLKPVVLLNQADNAALQSRGEHIANILRQAGLPQVHIISLHQYLAGKTK